jgi:hypothetical protein
MRSGEDKVNPAAQQLNGRQKSERCAIIFVTRVRVSFFILVKKKEEARLLHNTGRVAQSSSN